ncbi:MAG TPA: class I SAM-dependent RNA methyltransferase [bacterium]|nr:class I SAM-dependent RNA methyltransferase [bacterium]
MSTIKRMNHEPTTGPQPGEIGEIAVESLAPNGKGQGRGERGEWTNYSFFVEGAAPDDRLRVRVTGVRKRYVEADLVQILQASPQRVVPVCPYYEGCGGCQLMHLNYATQLRAKTDNLRYILRRNGFDGDLLSETIASPHPLRYRLRAKMSIADDLSPAWQRRRSHALISVRICPQLRDELARELFAAWPRLVADLPSAQAGEHQVSTVLDPSGEAVFMSLHRREDDASGPWFRARDGLLQPVDNPVCTMTVGETFLHFAPDCFVQNNEAINALLAPHAVDALAPEAEDRVLELYAGVGNFTVPLAMRAASVTAVEFPRAISFARRNAKTAALNNIEWLPMDASRALRALDKDRQRFDLALVDPPRTGMGEANARRLGSLGARRIVYVSCAPTALVAEMKELAQFGYRLTAIAAFDMFPQTPHAEACAVLELG